MPLCSINILVDTAKLEWGDNSTNLGWKRARYSVRRSKNTKKFPLGLRRKWIGILWSNQTTRLVQSSISAFVYMASFAHSHSASIQGTWAGSLRA